MTASKKSVPSVLARLLGEMKTERKRLAALERFVRKYGAALADLDVVPVLYSRGIDFDNLPHAIITKLLLLLGGKWEKSPNGERIDYSSVVDGVPIRFWQGEPPPSCRIVEEVIEVPEKVIPRHTETRRKVVCTETPRAEGEQAAKGEQTTATQSAADVL